MRIVISTGIYPPSIGGIATYAEGLAKGLAGLGHQVVVITYGADNGKPRADNFDVVSVSKSGGFLTRWLRYSETLREVGSDSDAVIALSSISCGVPLIFSGLKKPKRILRLGGDFFWERYTDWGGRRSLREWYASGFGFWKLTNGILMPPILHSFRSIVYSTEFQRGIHQSYYSALPQTSVIENARSAGMHVTHTAHFPFRLLFMGRFVGFKNLSALVVAMHRLPSVKLTLVGSGPMEPKLRGQAAAMHLGGRVEFLPPATGALKEKIFDEHDLLIIPSVTEISPNVALEAASRGLPVLVTEETGYEASPGISIKPLRSSGQIASAVTHAIGSYAAPAGIASTRNWNTIAADFQTLLQSL